MILTLRYTKNIISVFYTNCGEHVNTRGTHKGDISIVGINLTIEGDIGEI